MSRSSLDEFIDRYSSVKRLQENLKTNLEAITDLPEDDIDNLVRIQMILIRQCLEDFGAE